MCWAGHVQKNAMSCIEKIAVNTPFTIQRVLDRVMPVTESGCWIWTGYCAQHGYAQIGKGIKKFYIHRIVYEHFKGPIPPGLVIDHLCRVKCCLNPYHLEAVTSVVNILRGSPNANKTHCKRGHPLSGDNLLTVSTRKNYRWCRTCQDAHRAKAKETQDTLGICRRCDEKPKAGMKYCEKHLRLDRERHARKMEALWNAESRAVDL